MTDTAFKSIRDVAQELELEQHVLRFWETKFSQIRPTKRAGGRRYYRAEDVALLHCIKHLLHNQGYRISGVQKMIKDMGVRAFVRTNDPSQAPENAENSPANDDLQKTVLPSGQLSFMVSSDSPPQSNGIPDDMRAELGEILQDLKSIKRALS